MDINKIKKNINNQQPNVWYPEDSNLDKSWVEKIKQLFFSFDFELTFNKDYTKIKKTIWENNKPKYFKDEARKNKIRKK